MRDFILSYFVLFPPSNSFVFCGGTKYYNLVFRFWFVIIVVLSSPIIFKGMSLEPLFLKASSLAVTFVLSSDLTFDNSALA